jgi:hypothetical protein
MTHEGPAGSAGPSYFQDLRSDQAPSGRMSSLKANSDTS